MDNIKRFFPRVKDRGKRRPYFKPLALAMGSALFQALYAANGIWHDTVTTLAELRRTYPQDATLAASWENWCCRIEI